MTEIPAAPDVAKPNAMAEIEAAKVELRRDIVEIIAVAWLALDLADEGETP